MTPHNEAANGDFAKTVLMPGDPLRARYIAESFLSEAKIVNNVRGISGFTGKYKNKPVSVMASGMGMPSIGIYSYELFKFYSVDAIIRVGSAGALSEKINLRDVILAQGACSDSNFASQFALLGIFSPIADFSLLVCAHDALSARGAAFHTGNVLSSDFFYREEPADTLKWAKMGVLAVEMETAALYATAARLGKKALSILTVSDNIVTGEETSATERQTSFNDMIEAALEVAVM